eukprot:497807-Rhodomonas_salina.1
MRCDALHGADVALACRIPPGLAVAGAVHDHVLLPQLPRTQGRGPRLEARPLFLRCGAGCLDPTGDRDCDDDDAGDGVRDAVEGGRDRDAAVGDRGDGRDGHA